MKGGRPWSGAARVVLAATLIAVVAPEARGDGMNVVLEPTFTHTDNETTDQSGRTAHDSMDLLRQSYRLSLDRSLTDALVASIGGTLLDDQAWEHYGGATRKLDGLSSTMFGRLTLGIPVLTASAGVERTEQRPLGTAISFVNDDYSAFADWRPVDLPELSLRLDHLDLYDSSRRLENQTTDSALLNTHYAYDPFDVRYLATWAHTLDHLALVDTTSIDQSLLGTWSRSLFDQRTAAYASVQLTDHNVSTSVRGQGGTVAQQQTVVTGLSATEVFPVTSEYVVLTANPLLVDGNTKASAGVNVGFGASTAGDRNPRAVGGQFADVVTPVNTVFVWLDRTLTPEVGHALAGAVAAYQSEDNQHWTRVALVQPPVASPFENRIEITIAEVHARYVKVTLLPLAPAATTDPTYRDLFVSEVQFLLVTPAALMPHYQHSYTAAVNLTSRTLILRDIDLAWDAQGSVSYLGGAGNDMTLYTVINGLSAAQKLASTLALNGRVARQDQEIGRGHEGMWLWTAALVGTPLPTAFWSLTYSGITNDVDETITHSITALGRADLYEGISAQLNGTAAFLSQSAHMFRGIEVPEASSSTGQAGGLVSFTPNPFVTFSTGVLYSRSVAFTPATGDVVTEYGRLDGSVALTPAPALSASATVSRIFLAERPTTLATTLLNYYPLRGELQLTFAYSKTMDTTAEYTTEYYGPSLRWNIRSGVSLTSSYTVLNNVAAVQAFRSRIFATDLLIAL